jgi:hypothetical protein
VIFASPPSFFDTENHYTDDLPTFLEEIIFPQIVIRSSDFVRFKILVSSNLSFVWAKDNIGATLPTLTLHLWEDLSTYIVSGKVVGLGITYRVTLLTSMTNLMFSNEKRGD